MSLRGSIIDDKLADCVKESSDSHDVAFTKLVYSIIQRCDYEELQPEDMVDGGGDKQIDVLSLEEDQRVGQADLLILQVKNKATFEANALTLLGNGLSWVFEKRRSQYQRLTNVRLVRKIEVYRPWFLGHKDFLITRPLS